MRSCAFDHIPSCTTWRFSLLQPYLPGALTSKLPGLQSNCCSGQGRIRTHVSRSFMRLAKGPTLARAAIPFHMPLYSGSGNQLLTHISRLDGRGVRTVLRAALRFGTCTFLTTMCRQQSWQFHIALYRLFQDAERDLHVRKVQLQFVAFSNSAAVGFTFHLTLHSTCLGIFIAPFSLGSKPLRYVLLSPARPPQTVNWSEIALQT